MKRLAVACSLLVGCLPADTRPPPGEADVVLTGSANLSSTVAFTTVDDWQITFTRFFVSLGGVSFGGDSCTSYENDFYRRLFDARQTSPQKVAQKFALGSCELGFRVTNPDADSILMAGVTEQDLTEMRTAGTDKYATDPTPTSILVEGKSTNTKTGASKSFHWNFRGRRLTYGGCTLEPGGNPELFSFEGNAHQIIELRVTGEPLFRNALDPTKAQLSFGDFADADDSGDNDGDITFAELDNIPIDKAHLDLTVDADAGAPAPQWKTFLDFVYQGLFPQVVHLGERGSCGVQVGRPRGG